MLQFRFWTGVAQVIELLGQTPKDPGCGVLVDEFVDDPLPVISFEIPVLMEVRS